MKTSIVIDLGFGDSGKGITTDYLAKQDAENSLVIRFSGGHQVGHTVMKNDFIHTFSNLGSGTLRGVPTYYSEHTTLFPSGLLEEYGYVQSFAPKLIMHPLVMVTTPYDIAYNMAVEKANQHGSCGVGFGATVARNEAGVVLFAKDLAHKWVLEEKLKAIDGYYERLLAMDGRKEVLTYYREVVEDYDNDAFIRESMGSLTYFSIATLGEIYEGYEHLVFEGSQGILLDQLHGIFPHVTRSFTTCKNAMEIIQDLPKTGEIDLYYVSRCYQTRHGNGPMSSTEAVTLINDEHEANQTNEFQGALRTAVLDAQLLNYALVSDKVYHGQKTIKKHLVVTCLDQLPSFEVGELVKVLDCDFEGVLGSYSPDSKSFETI